MIKYSGLKKEYDLLEEKYQSLIAEKSELQYELSECKAGVEQLHTQDAQVRELHQSIRSLKHDMKNHLMVIASYLNAQEYEEAQAYTSEILDKLNAVHSYVETGNSLLNHILNEKFEYARRKGIPVKAEIENLSFDKMKSMDFSAMLSNMLDNAIEASEKEITLKPELVVNIFRKNNYHVICVKNRISKSVLEKNPNLCSTKEEGHMHGMGIPKTKEIAENYQGIFDVFEEDGFFCTSVFIPQ